MRLCGSRISRNWCVLVSVLVFVSFLDRIHAAEEVVPSDPYPLAKCVILDSELDENAEILYIGDREIRVCCEECVKEFNDSWMEVVDERITEQQKPFYPLKTCVVDGKPLEESDAIDFVCGNRLFRVCSDACRQAVKKTPAKYFADLNRAVIKKQKSTYPSKTCLVSGQPLGKKAVDYVVANQLVRLADSDQIERFNDNPAKYLAKLHALTKKNAK